MENNITSYECPDCKDYLVLRYVDKLKDLCCPKCEISYYPEDLDIE